MGASVTQTHRLDSAMEALSGQPEAEDESWFSASQALPDMAQPPRKVIWQCKDWEGRTFPPKRKRSANSESLIPQIDN